MIRLERLISPGMRESLIHALPATSPCTHFSTPLTLAECSHIAYCAGRLDRTGTAIQPEHVEEGFFTGTLFSRNRIRGCTDVVLIRADARNPQRITEAGILSEMLLIMLAAEGLQTCRLFDGYKQGLLPAVPGLDTIAVLAVGHGSMTSPPEAPSAGSRSHAGWPEPIVRAVQYATFMPSAGAVPSCQARWESHTLTLSTDQSDRFLFGCALAHAELALNIPHHWSVHAQGLSASASFMLQKA